MPMLHSCESSIRTSSTAHAIRIPGMAPAQPGLPSLRILSVQSRQFSAETRRATGFSKRLPRALGGPSLLGCADTSMESSRRGVQGLRSARRRTARSRSGHAQVHDWSRRSSSHASWPFLGQTPQSCTSQIRQLCVMARGHGKATDSPSSLRRGRCGEGPEPPRADLARSWAPPRSAATC